MASRIEMHLGSTGTDGTPAALASHETAKAGAFSREQDADGGVLAGRTQWSSLAPGLAAQTRGDPRLEETGVIREGMPTRSFAGISETLADGIPLTFPQAGERLSRAVANAPVDEALRLGTIRAGLIALLGFLGGAPSRVSLLAADTPLGRRGVRRGTRRLRGALSEGLNANRGGVIGGRSCATAAAPGPLSAAKPRHEGEPGWCGRRSRCDSREEVTEADASVVKALRPPLALGTQRACVGIASAAWSRWPHVGVSAERSVANTSGSIDIIMPHRGHGGSAYDNNHR